MITVFFDTLSLLVVGVVSCLVFSEDMPSLSAVGVVFCASPLSTASSPFLKDSGNSSFILLNSATVLKKHNTVVKAIVGNWELLQNGLWLKNTFCGSPLAI